MALVPLLRKMELVVEPELQAAAERAEGQGMSLLHVLVQDGLVDDEIVARLLAAQLNLNRVDLDGRQLDPRAVTMLPGALALRARAVPVGIRRVPEGDVLYVAMSNPADPRAVETVAKVTGMRLLPLVATEGGISRCLARVYSAAELSDQAPFGVLPPDEKLMASQSGPVPVVVGQLMSDPVGQPVEEDTLRDMRDSLLLMRGGSRGSSPDSPAPVEMDEWLTMSTQEVLDVYAPKAVEPAEVTPDDLAWLERKGTPISEATDLPSSAVASRTQSSRSATSRGGSPRRSAARTVPSLSASTSDAGHTVVDRVGPTAIVCPDIGLRAFVREQLGILVTHLADYVTLKDAVEDDVSLANVVLIQPESDGPLVQALRELRRREIPPRVYVVSPNKAFEVMGGVDVRLDPPRDDDRMADVVMAALTDRRGGRR